MMQSTKPRTDTKEIEPYTQKEIELIKTKFLNMKHKTSDFQKSHLIELKLILNDMLEFWSDNGKFQDPKLFSTLSKNMIGLADNMRRQDEGIKVNQDLSVSHNEFRKIIDISAKNLEEKETEFMEEHEKNNKRNNPPSRNKSKSRNTDN